MFLYAVLFFYLIVCTITDLSRMEIPLTLTFLMMGVGTLYNLMTGERSPAQLLLGLVLGAIFFGISYVSKEQIGMGDALVITVMSLIVGGLEVISILFGGFLILWVFSCLFLVFHRRKTRAIRIPLVPFILLGAIIHMGLII